METELTWRRLVCSSKRSQRKHKQLIIAMAVQEAGATAAHEFALGTKPTLMRIALQNGIVTWRLTQE